MQIEVLRNKTPQEVYADIDGFGKRYVEDWNARLAVESEARPQLFGKILRKWQATRPYTMRRMKADAVHAAPFLDNLLAQAIKPIETLDTLSLLTITHRTPQQREALNELWEIFLQLPTSGRASCVGITKAILLLTDGRIGPAFDSQVRNTLGVDRPTTCSEWLDILDALAEDIKAFEDSHGLLIHAVPERFANLAYGRLCDMALGPR